MKEKSNRVLVSAYGWAESVLSALLTVIVVFTFCIKTYRVDGMSMYPTLNDGERIVAVDLFYTPKRGDIVIVDENNSYGKPLVKRVVATEGQTVEVLSDGRLYIDGVLCDENPANVYGDLSYPYTVPDGCVFLMGDNREVSVDSRSLRIGAVDERSIVGKCITSF